MTTASHEPAHTPELRAGWGDKLAVVARGSAAITVLGKLSYAAVFLYGCIQLTPAIAAARELSRALTLSAESLTAVATEARGARSDVAEMRREMAVGFEAMRAACATGKR